MKKILSKLLGGVLLFNLSMSLTSCDPYLDDVLGEWSRPTPGNVTPGTDEGEVTSITVDLSKIDEKYLGSVVCSDGNVYPAKTAAPSGKTAVGILGKVTATGHGLILALQDATQQSWNTINSWGSVTTYAGTTLKQLPAGALGSLTSYTTLGSTTVSNWCVAQKSDYDAIFKNLGSAKYDSDGYTYDANVNAYITGVGGTAISGDYWSATEHPSGYGWCFSSSFWGSAGKGTNRNLRPVLGF